MLQQNILGILSLNIYLGNPSEQIQGLTCSSLQGTDRAGVWQRPGRSGGHQRGTAADGVGEDHPGLQERQTEAAQHWEE